MREESALDGTNGHPRDEQAHYSGRCPVPKRKVLKTAIIGAAAVVIVSAGLAVAACSSGASGGTVTTILPSGAGAANTVTVTGNATVTSPPDEAVVVLTVQNDAATAPAAMDATSVQSNQLLAKLKSLGIEDSAIQTSSITLYPVRQYEPNTGKETLTGYRADNSVKLTLKDAPTVAKVLAAGVETGVTLVSGPDWRLRDDSQAVNDALKLAVAHARTKAETLATAGGLSVGEVLSISENSTQVPVPIYSSASGAAVDSAKVTEPAVSGGSLDVTAAVTITYSLKR
jgi:uncharacterized protein